MSVIPHTEQEQARQSVPAITAFLRAAVWDLAYAGELPPEQALQLHHAAQLMLSASEQLVWASLGTVAEPAREYDTSPGAAHAAAMQDQTH